MNKTERALEEEFFASNLSLSDLDLDRQTRCTDIREKEDRGIYRRAAKTDRL